MELAFHFFFCYPAYHTTKQALAQFPTDAKRYTLRAIYGNAIIKGSLAGNVAAAAFCTAGTACPAPITKEAFTLTAREYIKKNANVPNALTLLRLLLVPVYVVLFVKGRKYAALLTFMVASFTDLLDGYIARKYNLITDFGKLMDPLADKVMVLTAMFSMVFGNRHIPGVIPLAAVLVLFAKEAYLMYGSYRLLKRGLVVHSQMSGKVAHCAFILGLVLSYFHDQLAEALPWLPVGIDVIIIWLAVAIALYAMVFYTRDSLQKLKEYEAAQPR